MKSSLRPRHAIVALLVMAACRGVPPAETTPRGVRLDDAQVAAIALIGNNVEIGYALLAPGRAADPDVVAFAARMHTDHTSLNATLTDLLARLDLPAREDSNGGALRDASIAPRERLHRLTGHAFDTAYIDTDIASHRALLDVIDRLLVPGVERRELRDYMVSLRPVVTAHLAHAEQLRATLADRAR